MAFMPLVEQIALCGRDSLKLDWRPTHLIKIKMV